MNRIFKLVQDRYFQLWVFYEFGWMSRGLSEKHYNELIGFEIIGLVLLYLAGYRRKKHNKAINHKQEAAKLTERAKAAAATDESKSTLTLKQLLLIEKLSNENDPDRASALAVLWKSIYGKEPDIDRPFVELVSEVSVAIAQMTS